MKNVRLMKTTTRSGILPTDTAIILRTDNEGQLDRIRSPNVQAVIYEPAVLPEWCAELASAVECGAFRLPRTILDNVGYADIETWLESNLPHDAVSTAVRGALLNDILFLADWERRSTGAERFIFRALTGTPSRHCGFHVDTIPPGAAPWGMLRVYNGAGTDYVDPNNVTAMRDFYRYLGRRERLVRDWCDARNRSDAGVYDNLQQSIVALDEARAFLIRPQDVFTARAGCIVAFKHLDVRLHWSSHAKELAWIHCSPMDGPPRFLVNIMPRISARRRSDP